MLGRIALKNIIYKPLHSALCICLLLFGVGIISILLLLQNKIEQKFERNTKNVDLVLGAKGSPLQLVLSSIYHLDSPTGNISLNEAKQIMEDEEVEEAIPLAYGDSYNGYRILGTTSNYAVKYDGEVIEGNMFSGSMEATIGHEIAEKLALRIGQTFLGTHGEEEGGSVHEDNPYTVIGILGKTNTVLDRLILTDIESIWAAHPIDSTMIQANLDHTHTHSHASDHGGEHAHDHSHFHVHDHVHIGGFGSSGRVITAGSKELTAVLLKYKSKATAIKMSSMINQETNMQALEPNEVVGRLFRLIGVGSKTIRLIALGIMILAGFGVFFILIDRLKDRKHELALLRSVGYSPTQLFTLLILEGLTLAIIGYVLGWILSRVVVFIMNGQAQEDFNLMFTLEWVHGEIWVLTFTIIIGFLSALIPAISAMRMDVASILSKK